MRPKTPSYRLHKASGQAIVTLNGKDHYLGKHDTLASRRAYDSLIIQWLAAGREIEDTLITVRVLCHRFMRHAVAYYRKRGELTPAYDLAERTCRLLEECHGKELADSFGPRKLKAIRDVWIEQGLARTTINQYARVIVEIFRWGVEDGTVPAPVWQSLLAVKRLAKGRSGARDTAKVQPVPIETVRATLPKCSKRLAAMIQIQLFTGMRSGELLGMRPCDIDRSGPTWLYRPVIHKNEHRGIDRVVGIGPAVQAMLLPYLDVPPTTMLFWSPRERTTEKQYKGSVIRRRVMNYARDVESACIRTWPCPNLPYKTISRLTPEQREIRKVHIRTIRWHPHQLRHTAATFLRADADIEAARIGLGHASVTMTEHYAEPDRAAIIERSTASLESFAARFAYVRADASSQATKSQS